MIRDSNDQDPLTSRTLPAGYQALVARNGELEERIRALEQANVALQSLLDAGDTGKLFLDTTLRLRRHTSAATPMLRLGPDDIGRPLSELAGRIDDPALLDDAERLLGGETPAAREVSGEDGRWYLRRLLPARGGRQEPAGAVLTLTDITERRRSAEAIERLHNENAARLKEMHALFDAAPIGIFVGRDPDCRNMEMNRAGARMLRIDERVNPSMSGPDASALPFRVFHQGRELRDDELPMQTAARTGRRIEGFEEELLFADGETRSLITYAAPLTDDDGRVYGCVGTFADVTRSRAEERRFRETLAEADRRKDEFLSMLGHELRNPLAPMRGALDVLAARRDDPATLDWALALMDRQMRHLQRLVDDLLDVARITRGAITLKTAPLDLAGAVQEALETVDGLVRERRHRVTAELPPGPVPVEGDATRLVQVFVNLLNNAARYTEPGGRIRVNVGVADGCARVSVEDNGCGIDPDVLPHVFDTFRQGRVGLARSDGGLGLGLALVRRLVEMHGGSVVAASAGPGCGSRFDVVLPLGAGVPAAGDAETAESRSTVSPGRRVLVVDDVADIRESSAMLLELLGYQVSTAASGEEALAAVERSRPDVVLLDIGLQGMDGIEVARRLAERPDRAALRVVALSGYGDGLVDADDGLFDAHLLKPADLAGLKAALA